MIEPEEKKVRISKLNQLKKNINPYPYSFNRTHTTREIKENFSILEGKTVKIAGRIIARRDHGKTIFFDIRDFYGKIQVYARKKDLNEKFVLFSYTDIGDFLGVEGEIFKTKTGEITIHVKDFSILSKSLLPLPEKWHGLKDIETRYRKRYLDMIANPEVIETFLIRTKIVNLIREFLNKKGFIEVETPILQPLYGGASARPFVTYYHALEREFYLRIADELYLKRLIVGGFEKVYEIGKDFRNEGLDRLHNPEFTQLELYQAYADYHDMMKITEEMFKFLAEKLYGTSVIEFQNEKIDFSKPWKRLRFTEELEKVTGKDVLSLSEEELRNLCKEYEIEITERTTVGKMIDKLFSELVQEKIKEPTFVMDHPKIISPLAKTHRNDERLVERFEPVIMGIEVGNAFSELNDPIEQRKRFEEQIKAREEYTVIDEDFLSALEYGMPPTGGLGIGIDRVVMIFTDKPSIRDVIIFPHLRPEE